MQELKAAFAASKVLLQIELPDFPHAVMYQQAAVPSGPHPSATGGISRGLAPGETPSDGSKLIILQVGLQAICHPNFTSHDNSKNAC